MSDGILYVVATPIGNLEDISGRAANVLSSVTTIAAEDTRHTQSLLAALGIRVPRLLALHEHNEGPAGDLVIAEVRAGGCVALVSDAGTPLLSDPGFTLIRRCFELGLDVRPVPGPSAVCCALSVCPLPTTDVQFVGFLPAKPVARLARLEQFVAYAHPVLFFEAPHRVREVLTVLDALAPSRRLFVGREMTKRFESYLCDTPAGLVATLDRTDAWRGEFVCLLEGQRGARSSVTLSVTLDAERLMAVLGAELPPSQAARLGAELLGVPKSELYDLAVKLKR